MEPQNGADVQRGKGEDLGGRSPLSRERRVGREHSPRTPRQPQTDKQCKRYCREM